jgi:hypothetical protein
MTTTQTAGGPKVSTNGNGAPKQKRPRKALDAAAAASKIAAVLKGLDTDERNKAMKILAVLTESTP